MVPIFMFHPLCRYSLDRIPNFILEQNRPQKWTRHPSKPLVCRIGSLFCSKITLGPIWVNLGPIWAHFGPKSQTQNIENYFLSFFSYLWTTCVYLGPKLTILALGLFGSFLGIFRRSLRAILSTKEIAVKKFHKITFLSFVELNILRGQTSSYVS